jgi:hypothetical protein
MERNLRQNLSLSIIARHARMSTRTLSAEVSFAYMWSADQILGPAGHWHPHMMVYVPNYDNSCSETTTLGAIFQSSETMPEHHSLSGPFLWTTNWP